MRGFIVGTLALVVLYVALQDTSAFRLVEGTGLAAEGFKRLISPDVAGIPARGNWGAPVSAGSTGAPAATVQRRGTGLPAGTPVYV